MWSSSIIIIIVSIITIIAIAIIVAVINFIITRKVSTLVGFVEQMRRLLVFSHKGLVLEGACPMM